LVTIGFLFSKARWVLRRHRRAANQSEEKVENGHMGGVNYHGRKEVK
jgi:hypothetical protein